MVLEGEGRFEHGKPSLEYSHDEREQVVRIETMDINYFTYHYLNLKKNTKLN